MLLQDLAAFVIGFELAIVELEEQNLVGRFFLCCGIKSIFSLFALRLGSVEMNLKGFLIEVGKVDEIRQKGLDLSHVVYIEGSAPEFSQASERCEYLFRSPSTLLLMLSKVVARCLRV
jgi:hypothetical protein